MASNNSFLTNDVTPLFVGHVHSAKSKTILTGQTLLKGAVMGKQEILIGTATAGGSNTGDGTVTELALVATGAAAKLGSYILTCITAVTNGGIFKLVDPDGLLIADDITIAAGAGGIIVFTGAGITFKITDGTTDFAAADFYTITVIAGSGKLVMVVSTAADGSDIPVYVMLQALTTTADVVQDVGERGDVVEAKLVFGGSDTIATIASNGLSYRDNLKHVGILPIPHKQLSNLDNL